MLYRVSQSTLYRNINYNLGSLTWQMAKRNEQLATGKRINKPSDDPSGESTVMSMRTVLEDIKQYNKNVALADDWLKTSESVIQSMKDTIERAKVLAEQMSTETYTDQNMDVAAEEIDKLFESMIKMGNSRIGVGYIFAGQSTDTQPFREDLTIWDVISDPYNSVFFTGKVMTQGDRIFNYRPDIPPQTQKFLVEVTSPGGILSGTSGYSLSRLTLDPSGGHNALFFEANDTPGYLGSNGNTLQIQYSSALGQASASVSVTGSAIVVELGMSGTTVTTTAKEIMDLINTHSSASGMVTASLAPGNAGSGTVTATALTNLEFGYDTAARYRVSQDGGLTWSVHDAFTADDLRNNDLIYNTELGHASLTTNMPGFGNDLYFTAKHLGSYGNDIRVQFVDDQPAGSAMSVEVGPNPWNITVHLETSASTGIVTTAFDIMSAINNHASASNLLTCSLADYREGGGDPVTTMDLTRLKGGDNDMDPLGHATYTTQFDYTPPEEKNPNIRFTSLVHGTSGNNLQIEYSSACAQTFTSFSVSGSVITVHLANSGSNILTAAQDIVDMFTSAYVMNPASALVTASLLEHPDGKPGVVSPMTTVSFSGGDPLLDEANHGINIRFDPDKSPLLLGDRFEIDVSYYGGDEYNLDVNANQDTRVKANATGVEVLGDAAASDNILDTLARLKYALELHDNEKVADELPRLTNALEKLTSQMSRSGVRIIRNQFIFNVLESTKISSTERLSRFEDVDFEEAITALTVSQTAYQATLASTSKITQLSLVDYIR